MSNQYAVLGAGSILQQGKRAEASVCPMDIRDMSHATLDSSHVLFFALLWYKVRNTMPPLYIMSLLGQRTVHTLYHIRMTITGVKY
jgi:hypothetical protein